MKTKFSLALMLFSTVLSCSEDRVEKKAPPEQDKAEEQHAPTQESPSTPSNTPAPVQESSSAPVATPTLPQPQVSIAPAKTPAPVQESASEKAATPTLPQPQVALATENTLASTPEVVQEDFRTRCNNAWKKSEIEKTYKALKIATQSHSCADLQSIVEQTKYLDLRAQNISILEPLVDFVNLKGIDLSQNNIKDISALEQLPELLIVDLSENPEFDATPLYEHAKLKTFFYGTPSKTHRIEKNLSVATKDSEEKSCRHSYLMDPYKSCRHESFGIERYKEGSGEVCGFKDYEYNSCRHISHGIDRSPGGPLEGKTLTYSEDFKMDAQGYISDLIRDTKAICRKKFDSDFANILHKQYLPQNLFWDAIREQVILWNRKNLTIWDSDQTQDKSLNGHFVEVDHISCVLHYGRYVPISKPGPECGVKNVIYKVCEHQSFGPIYREDKGEVCGKTGKLLTLDLDAGQSFPSKEGAFSGCLHCENLGGSSLQAITKKLNCFSESSSLVSSSEDRLLRGSLLGEYLGDTGASFFTREQFKEFLQLALLAENDNH